MHSLHADPIIELKEIAVGWGNRVILSHVNLCVNRGDFMAITGPNGGGKSTLLSVLLKLLSPLSGTVTYYNSAGDKTNKLHIGYLPQKNKIDSHFPITVREVISSGLLGPFGKTIVNKTTAVDDTLGIVGLREYASSPIGNLSGGQLQRALLGRAIISKPEILVLDEPLSYLDKHFEQQVYRLLEELATSSTIVLVSHEMTTIARMATRHMIVDHGVHECTASHHYYHTCDEDENI